MAKSYRITYNLFQNTRLKKVDFHGLVVYSLYIRIVFNRQSTFLKSSLFDFYLKEKFTPVIRKSPSTFLEEIRKREEEAIGVVIKSLGEDFSLQKFLEMYSQNMVNIVSLMEGVAFQTLADYFNREQQFIFESMVKEAEGKFMFSLLIDNLKVISKQSHYLKIVEALQTNDCPILPLFHFLKIYRFLLPEFLPRYLWESKLKTEFFSYITKHHPHFSLKDL